ncbi:MAG: (d)CMP kinase [Caldiserica bacterium]|nr:MAG: (d)CMP kinase [Caldisericota bacterium]HDH63093.1 (d)CMP kinase [Bacillota bacterium]
MIIAIDGPSASGKSRLGKNLSKKLNIKFIDSGKLYRIIAYLYMKEGKGEIESFLKSKNWWNVFQKNFGDELYSPEVSEITSILSTKESVRETVNKFLRDLYTHCKNLIVAGRDIGTVVFKDADLKVFLTASEEERKRRRIKQMKELGYSPEFIDKEILRRDKRDSTRKIAPLKPAEDAIIIDNTNLKKEETLNIVLEELKKRGLI